MFSKKKNSTSGRRLFGGSSSTPVPRRRIAQEDDGTPSVSPQFRRNQTLSSYRGAGASAEASSRQKAHQLVVQRRRFGLFFAITAGVAMVMLLLLWQLLARVEVVTSSKQLAKAFDSKAYEQVVFNYLMQNPANRMRATLNEAALSEYVSTELPEVESLTLGNLTGVAQSSLTVTFRKPVAGWQINSRQYYVDSHGVVFEKNYYETPDVQIVDESGIRPEQGSAVVGSRVLGFLGRVVSEAQGRGYTAERAVMPAGVTRQVDVYFKDVTTRVKFSIDRGAGEQMEDAARALGYLKSLGEAPGYIDVRVSGRAAYK